MTAHLLPVTCPPCGGPLHPVNSSIAAWDQGVAVFVCDRCGSETTAFVQLVVRNGASNGPKAAAGTGRRYRQPECVA